jgi:hypothetical protein
MQRWVGLGVIADNLVNIGRALQKQAPQYHSPPYRKVLRHPTRPTGGPWCVEAVDWSSETFDFCAEK